jgi:hypothetical protein
MGHNAKSRIIKMRRIRGLRQPLFDLGLVAINQRRVTRLVAEDGRGVARTRRASTGTEVGEIVHRWTNKRMIARALSGASRLG